MITEATFAKNAGSSLSDPEKASHKNKKKKKIESQNVTSAK
jgi:hypothetical protein